MLITGASGGIGRCLAEQAARAGARLLLAARSADKLEELSGRLRARGAEVITVACDLAVDADRRRLVQTAAESWDKLDILVNNAGIGSWGHFIDSSEAILRQVMEVNFFAPAELIRLTLPLLRRGRQPAVVNISSRCGRRGLPAWPEYSASKFALCGLTEALRGEMARYDIDVLLVVPGLTGSDMPHNLLRTEGRMPIRFERGMTPEYVAEQILLAIRKNRAETVLGADARRLLTANRFFPSLVDWLTRRRIRQLYQEQAVP
jgi:short-subunit dehydrogenase